MRLVAHLWRTALLLGLLLPGCAATVPLAPAALDTATKQFPPLHEQAALYLVRLPQHLGTRTIFPLHVDGVLVGGLAPGTYLKRTLTPGTHTVHALTAENQASLQIAVQAGQRVFVRVVPKDWGMVVRVDLVRLDERAGREAVMQTAMSADSD